MAGPEDPSCFPLFQGRWVTPSPITLAGLPTPSLIHVGSEAWTRTLRKASREPFSMYSVTIIAKRPGWWRGDGWLLAKDGAVHW